MYLYSNKKPPKKWTRSINNMRVLNFVELLEYVRKVTGDFIHALYKYNKSALLSFPNNNNNKWILTIIGIIKNERKEEEKRKKKLPKENCMIGR